MRSDGPRIGITLSEAEEVNASRWPLRGGFDYIKRQYYQAVLKSGGVPILLPNVEERRGPDAFIEIIQGLLITGGLDLHPAYFHQKPHARLTRTTVARDRFEMRMIELGMRKNMPILGICRGHQVLNVVFGGSLYQDLSCIPHKILRHADRWQSGRVYHRVRIEKGSRLHKIIGRSSIEINSSHHQAIDRLGDGLRLVAFAEDGIIEGIEHPDFHFLIGVQWHPENIYERSHSKRLFDAFVTGAARRH